MKKQKTFGFLGEKGSNYLKTSKCLVAVLVIVKDIHHRIQSSPINNFLTKSFVVNTLTNDCFLMCGSLDHIAALIANARKSTSSGSGNNVVAFSRNPHIQKL